MPPLGVAIRRAPFLLASTVAATSTTGTVVIIPAAAGSLLHVHNVELPGEGAKPLPVDRRHSAAAPVYGGAGRSAAGTLGQLGRVITVLGPPGPDGRGAIFVPLGWCCLVSALTPHRRPFALPFPRRAGGARGEDGQESGDAALELRLTIQQGTCTAGGGGVRSCAASERCKE